MASARAQHLLQSTPEGQKVFKELLNACVADGGLKQVGQGRAMTWRIDKDKLRSMLATRRGQLTPAVRDCLVIGCALEDARLPVFIAVLEAFGQEGKDERALGFAAFFSGRSMEKQRRPAEAEAAYRRAIEQFRTVSEEGWLADSVNNLGLLLQARRDYAGAAKLLREGLALYRKLYPKDKYPDGSWELANSLNNVGGLLADGGDFAGAEVFLRDALVMRRKLYPKDKHPDGHRDLAVSLNNLGFVLQARGDYAVAEPLLREALAMNQKLHPKDKYPQGHPELANSMKNLGFMQRDRGNYAGAETLYREALDMYRKLYPKDKHPDGHQDLATTIILDNLGFVLRMGDRGWWISAWPRRWAATSRRPPGLSHHPGQSGRLPCRPTSA
jgi:tetratricopeptide (TPR) repeat protein